MSDPAEPAPERVIAYPSDRLWFDPRVIMANCELLTIDIVNNDFEPIMALPSDPMRVAVGVCGAPEGIGFGPWPDCNIYPFSRTSFGRTDWYYLHVHLNLVCNSWWLSPSTGGTVRFITIRRM